MTIFPILFAALLEGPFPILSTPYFENGAVDFESLTRQVAFVDRSGCPGAIFGQSNDSVDLLTWTERTNAFEVCARAAEGLSLTMAFGANGTNTAHMLEIAAAICRTAERHPKVRFAIVSRPPNDARSQEDIERAWDALGSSVKWPVIMQTHGAKGVPEPSVELMVRLAERHPGVFGYIKEEAAGDSANQRMVEENAAKPAIKAVFSGWGGWQWLYQLRRCGSAGLITERVAFAPILGHMWKLWKDGERGDRLTAAYAMYRLLIDQRNFPGGAGLRGYPMYYLKKNGLASSTVSRQYLHREVTEGGTFGWGEGWKLESVELSGRQRAELDALYDDMLNFINTNNNDRRLRQ